MGGSDDASNIVSLTIEEHAEAHRKLYEMYNKYEDYLAWKCLSGQVQKKDILRERSRLGGLNASAQNKEHGKGIFSRTEEQTKEWACKAGKAAQARRKPEDNSKHLIKARTVLNDLIKKDENYLKERNESISKAKKGKAKPNSASFKSKSVKIDGILYESLSAAAKKYDTDAKNVSRRCKSDKWPTWSFS